MWKYQSFKRKIYQLKETRCDYCVKLLQYCTFSVTKIIQHYGPFLFPEKLYTEKNVELHSQANA